MRTMHMFAGAGGGLLADLILGHTPVAAVEWSPYACQVLRERAADGWFPGLRVHEGDVRLFDPSDYAGRVDCIHAGFPCQDLSNAGNRAGLAEGTRSGLYREVLRIAGVVRPRHLFLENVAAILSGGLGTVLGDLAARGYDCRWCCLEASGVGAPHRRDRWWLLATMADAEGERCGEAGGLRCREPEERPAGGGEGLANADVILGHEGRSRHAAQWQEWRDADRSGCAADVPDPDRARLAQREGRPDDHGAQLAPTVGADWWATEPDLGRVAHGVAARVDRLKALGNGQVPLQAAVAWRILGGMTA